MKTNSTPRREDASPEQLEKKERINILDESIMEENEYLEETASVVKEKRNT